LTLRATTDKVRKTAVFGALAVFKLTIEDDEGKTTVVPLARDEMTIGRHEGNTIRLTERNVSRRHARLVRQNGAIFIEDLSSFTGVRVNGTKIASPTPLREGDEVQIGDYRMALRGERPAPGPSIADRPTMPSMPAAMGPMATVGGSVAIPTRASVAAMATQPLPTVAATPSPSPQPIVVGGPGRKSGNGPAVVLAGAAAQVDVAPVAPYPAALTPAPIPIRDVSPVRLAAEPAAPEISEAQPTVPIRTLGEAAAPGPAARLCALTTDLAGTQYALDRASLVMGRTDENDVVIPHRSISRHHAKIVRDGDHYTIVDLQSANGVRVNGEDYERIELNSGDIIELGHVKLRFVAPHESYTFDPRAAGAPARSTMPTRIVILGAAGAALAAGLIWSVAHRGQRGATASETPPPAVAAVPPPAPPTPAPAAAPAAEVAPAPEPEVAPEPASPAVVLADARAAAAAEDWDKARAALDRLGLTIPDPVVRRDALGLRRRVDTERQAAIAFGQFDDAVGAKNFADAVARYQEIPAESIYKRRARPRFEEARTAVVAEHLATAERARAAGRCTEVRSEAEEVLKLDPHNLLARDMVKLCRTRAEAAPVAARPSARPRASAALVSDSRPELAASRRPAEPARTEKHAEAARPEAVAAAEDGPDPDALMKQAREAWMRQQCGAAIEFSRKALHAKPGMTDAYQIIAVCSCTLKDGEAAGRAYAKLDDKNRNLVRALCQKNGIAVGE
jgi:pSer/pThr/pTyr-binding forkhead associated (FHA) protein